MPLTDLVRYFNLADAAGESTLYLEGERAAAWHMGLRLGSLFQPIVDLQRERVVGHRASLSARREDGMPVSCEAAYALCETAEAVIHFDRLCRTLHALNLLAQRRHVGGYLQLAVHPRHLRAVQNQHGLVYEAILKRCGLGPTDIVLEIDTGQGSLDARLGEAVNSYRQRGYRLALSVPPEDAAPAALLAHDGKDGCHIWGQVPDVRPYLAAADVAVVPLEIARGVQNKVLEAMAMACPVVLTPEAAIGIGGQDGVHYAVAGDDAAFVAQACRLVDDRQAGMAMGQAARRFVIDNLGWEAVLAPLAEMVSKAPVSQECRDAA